MVHVIETEGLLGLWRGFVPQLISYFPTQTITFALRDCFINSLARLVGVKDNIDVENVHHQTAGQIAIWFFNRLTAGALAGAFTLTLLYPLHFANVQLLADIGTISSKSGNPIPIPVLWPCAPQMD